MTIQIQAGIIHQIQKSQHTTTNATLHLQKTLHTVNDQLSTFVEYAETQLQKSGRNSSISGGFGIQNTLSKVLADHYFSTTPIDYLQLSKDIAIGLFDFVKKKSATTGEYLPLVFYREDGIDYLLISLISLNKYININSTTGEFSETNAIDNDALKVGVKVNLTVMTQHYSNPNKEPENNYIQWIQRGRKKLVDYIQDFIPVSQRVDDTKNTKMLLQSIKNYTKETFTDPKVRHQVETNVFTLIRTKLDDNEPIHIEEDIDTLLDSALVTHGLSNKPKFNEYRQVNKITVDSSFKIDAEKLTPYEKFDLTLAETGIIIKGQISELGQTIRAVVNDDENKKYLLIEINDEEYTQMTTKYSSLLQ